MLYLESPFLWPGHLAERATGPENIWQMSGHDMSNLPKPIEAKEEDIFLDRTLTHIYIQLLHTPRNLHRIQCHLLKEQITV